LQIKKVSLNLISSLLNQYFPIAFQFSIGSQNKPLIFSSFLRSNIKTIQDIWDEKSKQFIDCDLLYNKTRETVSQNTLKLRNVFQKTT
jgi:hypothetical protein